MSAYEVAFGLSFDVAVSEDGKFTPAETDRGGNLNGGLRLAGFAAALETNFANHLFLVGGYNKVHGFSKPEKISNMLPLYLQSKVAYQDSRAHTLGNTEVIMSEIRRRDLDTKKCCVITSLYHIARAKMMLDENGILDLRAFPAEALALLGKQFTKESLLEELGGGGLAERYANECQGAADWIGKTYTVNE